MSISTSATRYNIEPLKANNYSAWKEKMKMILIKEKNWRIVSGKETKPKWMPPTSDPERAPTEEHLRAVEKWEEKAEDAVASICLAIDSSQSVHVKNITDPMEIWKKLEEVYEPKTRTALNQLARRFHELKYREGAETMQEFVNRAQQIVDQLAEHGYKMSELDVTSVLLNSLPESYSTIVSILEDKEDLSTNAVISKILDEARKRTAIDGAQPSTAFTSQGGKRLQNQIKKSNSNLKCTYCNGTRHVEADCWLKHPEKRPAKMQTSKSKAQKSISFSARTIQLEAEKGDPNHWYLDSAASEHFTPHRDIIKSYQLLKEPKEIVMADGVVRHGVGKGIVEITALADNREVSITIHNVFYVPEMEANLLSTTTLLDKGFEISMKPGKGISILKDNALMADTIREGMLYRLKVKSPSRAQKA